MPEPIPGLPSEDLTPDPGEPGRRPGTANGSTVDGRAEAGGPPVYRHHVPRELLEAEPASAGPDEGPPDTRATTPPRPSSAPVGPAAWPHLSGYEVLGELGRGGMGVVYQARQVLLDRTVALKMIRAGAGADEEDLARFRLEAEAVARLQHPNIIQIFEVGQLDGQPFFSLEFVAGGALEDRLAAGPLADAAAAELVETLARAMHAAHQKGIIHRDLKPANVLMTADGTPKITDFGLAKRLEGGPGQTQSGAIMGTPSYMAPEQARGEIIRIGPPADVYALGAILYEIVSGRPPFKGPTSLDTVLQVINDEPVPLSYLQPRVARDLETICMKCLEKEPARRYASAADLADDLRRFRLGEPIRARRVGWGERALKFARRRPAVAAALGVGVLFVAAVVVSLGLLALYQAKQKDLLQQELKKADEMRLVREQVQELFPKIDKLEADGHWEAAEKELEKLRDILAAQPELSNDPLSIKVKQRLAQVRPRVAARERLKRFRVPYEESHFYDTLFTGLDIVANRVKARESIRAALAVYGLDREAAFAGRHPPLLERERQLLNKGDQDWLAEACYELLLIQAEDEAAPPPGRAETEKQARERAARALALLRRAGRLGRAYHLKSRTYHLLEARCLARGKGEPFDRSQAERNAPPQATLDWFLDGLQRYRDGRYEEARQACAEALALNKNHYYARYVLALCHLRLGRWAEGKAELTVCVNLRPDKHWLRLLRGFAEAELGHRLNVADLAQAEYRAAEADINAALKADQSRMAQYVGLANRGALNYRRKRLTEAVADFEQAVTVNPEGSAGYINLAQALQDLGRPREALAALNKAIKLVPNVAALHENRARLYLLLKNRTAARADFQRAVELEPKDSTSDLLVRCLVELGRLFHREGKYATALACYDRVLRQRPAYLLAQRFRAETLLALDRPTEAGRALDQYLAANKQATADVYQARGLICAGTGDLPGAIEMYTLALRQNPNDVETRCFRGWTYLLTDAVRLALKDFETCLKEEPTSADALAGRGNARVRLKQVDAALDDARAAEKAGPVTDRLLYNLLRIYAQAAAQMDAEAQTARLELARRAAQLREVYRETALDYLARTLDQLPEERRAAFWQKQVAADPALAAIRQGPRYGKLAARYGRATK